MIISGSRKAPSGGHIVLIALFALVAGLSGLMTVPPLDRDESRFVQATTQMIETGDYVRIRFQDEERNKKPVGIYWLQAGSVLTFADVEDRPLWAYRLPSLLGAMLASIFTYIAGCALFGRRPGLAAGLLLAAAPVVMGEASIAKTDAVLLACVCGMQAALAWMLTSEMGKAQYRIALGFWAAMGAGILIKGPIAPAVALFTLAGIAIFQLERKDWWAFIRHLKPVSGVLLLLAMIAPWAIAIGIATEGRFFAEAVGIDMLSKVSEPQESHAAPAGAHFLLFWGMFWPAALFILAAGRHAGERWKEGPFFFCFAWLVPMWLLFEISQTKLPHYPMVLYPALALICGQLIATVPEVKYRGLRAAGAVIYAIIGLGSVAAILILANHFSTAGLTIWHYLGAALICVVCLGASVLAIIKRSGPALAAAIAASALFAWGTFEGVLPTLDRLAMTPALAKMLDAHEAHPLKDNTGPIALVGYSEPSAVFTLGTQTKLLRPKEGALWLTTAPNRAIVVEERDELAFLSSFPEGRMPVRIASIEGFNYSKNRNIRLTLFRLSAP
ncbi:ArnT family glycosyltransferase [Parvularcula marina]|uniref:Glycosyltransferase family 39 protein n=1 Tax=Parvularcula marina TaxID=2292771 RepID=A0A371RH51_9PROT|nr:glycosyltransferase family 39 protein [Parvularcula marina]RFB04770.1 glycosyltransferase family 39 protein [Parvularcula marina]